MKSFVPFTLALIAAVHAQTVSHGVETDPLYDAELRSLEDAEVAHVSDLETTNFVDPVTEYDFYHTGNEYDLGTTELDNTTEAEIVSET
jgi:hypothetical protein